MSEEWRPLPGYEGFYEVSNEGRVESSRRRGTPGRVLRPITDSAGYLSVALSKPGGKPKRARVHVIVACAFLGTRPTGAEIRHLNGDPLDNRVGNLAYGTKSENAQDTLRHGRHNHASKTHCKNGHEFTPENTYRDARQRHCRTCSSRPARRARRAAKVGGVR